MEIYLFFWIINHAAPLKSAMKNKNQKIGPNVNQSAIN